MDTKKYLAVFSLLLVVLTLSACGAIGLGMNYEATSNVLNEFEEELGLHHDLISTDRSYSRPDFVNPIIIDLLHTNEEE